MIALVCLALTGAYPLVVGDSFNTFALAGSIVAVSLSAVLVGVVVRWRLYTPAEIPT